MDKHLTYEEYEKVLRQFKDEEPIEGDKEEFLKRVLELGEEAEGLSLFVD